MGKIFDSFLGKSTPVVEGDYMELNLEDYEGMDEPPALLVKIATISDIKDSPKIKDEIYNGNIVIVDISRLKMDKVMYERVLKDLKEVTKDVNGDIIGLGEQKYIIITPAGVKISRDKLGGS